MFQLGAGLADAQAENKAAIQFGVGEEDSAAFVESIHDLLVQVIAAPVAKADQVERGRGNDIEMFIGCNPANHLPGQFDVPADMVLQAFDTVIAQHETRA